MTTIDEIMFAAADLGDARILARAGRGEPNSVTERHAELRTIITQAIAEAREDGARDAKREPVLLTDEQLDALADEVFDLIQDEPDDDVGDRTWDRMFGRAIETAVLAANGLEAK